MDRPENPSDALPVTAEVGGEGGSYGDAASRQSRERPADGPDRVRNETVTDIVGNVTRLPEQREEAASPADDLRPPPTE
jgi:hypothetical protein